MMTFNVWEWLRLICYASATPAACYLAVRASHRHDGMQALLWSGLALMFGWYMIDLTMISAGISSRETRSFATPITVFVSGGIVSMALREMHMHLRERRLRDELTQLEKPLEEMQNDKAVTL